MTRREKLPCSTCSTCEHSRPLSHHANLEDCTPLVRVRWMSDNPFTQGA